MSEYKKYQHVEKYGTDETDGIDVGKCYIFPKIDGTNGKVWFGDGVIKYGSRRRELIDDDNQGFKHELSKDDRYLQFFNDNPDLILFGEWLVKHTVNYRDNAYRQFYIFDVCELLPEELPSGEKFKYLVYEDYQLILEKYNLSFLTPLRIMTNPTEQKLLSYLDINDVLMPDGETGEGIVIKNYDYTNKYGRTTWAKIVRAEFKEKHRRTMGAPESEMIPTEKRIINNYLTEALIEKTYQKIKEDGWNSRKISELLGRVWHDFITEEIFEVVKKEKNPVINFKKLNQYCTMKIKETKPDVF